jgi:hypothetical protein
MAYYNINIINNKNTSLPNFSTSSEIMGRVRNFDRNVPRKPRLVGGVKGHNINETSFAHILFATGVSGKPRPVGGELHI